MKIIGIAIDYSNICKDYNTVYLDRDNTDMATFKCMKQVTTWTNKFFSELLEIFELQVHSLSSSSVVNIDDIASKRFLFYSLEKEIMLQSYVLHNEYTYYENLAAWELENNGSVLVKNDEDGGAIYLFLEKDSKIYQWIIDNLKEFSLDEVPFQVK